MKRWIASDYLDLGKWGILTEDNEIVAGISFGLTREQVERLVASHNLHAGLEGGK